MAEVRALRASNDRPPVPKGFEAFYRASFTNLVTVAMYAGATLEEGEDAAAKALEETLRNWDAIERPFAWARKATVHNFIKERDRGPARVARRLFQQRCIPHWEGAEDSQLTAWEDDEWVASVLSSLPPAQREVMELFVKQLDRDEIAQALGKTKEAIRRNLCDARARLARELNPDGERRQNPGSEYHRQPRRMARAPREEAR